MALAALLLLTLLPLPFKVVLRFDLSFTFDGPLNHSSDKEVTVDILMFVQDQDIGTVTFVI